MNLAGVKLVMPATPYDAKGLMKSAIRDNNPVIFFEDQILALRGARGPVPGGIHHVPLGVAEVKRPGNDVTVIAIAKMVPEALAAAEALARDGIAAEVVDPAPWCRWIRPRYAPQCKKPAAWSSSMKPASPVAPPAEIAALLTEDAPAFRALQAPPKRVCAPDVPIPYSPVMEQFCLPDTQRIVQGTGGSCVLTGASARRPYHHRCLPQHPHIPRQTCLHGRSALMRTSHMPRSGGEHDGRTARTYTGGSAWLFT